MLNTMDNHYVFIFMGVSGSGKSVVARKIAQKLNTSFIDGDFLHPRANIIKMASGQALTDADRQPWLKALNDAIFAMQRTQKVSLLVCSALKKSYRDVLRQGNPDLKFIYLQGDISIIEQRVKKRQGHFFRPELLKTQFDSLQPPSADETDILSVDITPPLSIVIQQSLTLIEQCIMSEPAQATS